MKTIQDCRSTGLAQGAVQEIRIINGQSVLATICPPSRRGQKRQMMKVSAVSHGQRGVKWLHATYNTLRCSSCNTLITKEQEKYSGMCGKCIQK